MNIKKIFTIDFHDEHTDKKDNNEIYVVEEEKYIADEHVQILIQQKMAMMQNIGNW